MAMPERTPVGLPLRVVHGDCIAVMATMAEASVDAIVTDPPYGLAFMGKEWDHGIPIAWIPEALRVLKPGGHLLAFGGTRTYHRLTCALEDAGFEIRDCLMWLYGSGFPKSLDVSKAIDKAAGATREYRPDPKWIEKYPHGPGGGDASEMVRQAARKSDGPLMTSDPATDAAREWAGWGTALKPSWEPIILARKPLGEKNVAANVLRHGVGALNVDGCRIGYANASDQRSAIPQGKATSKTPNGPGMAAQPDAGRALDRVEFAADNTKGRWPANLVLDEDSYTDVGGASRFFYCAKASRSERSTNGHIPNTHPTVKPIALMRWLVRLVTPPRGLVLDPFAGSGTTLIAAARERRRALGIEQHESDVKVIEARLAHERTHPTEVCDV
jgi:DNA modification methylase